VKPKRFDLAQANPHPRGHTRMEFQPAGEGRDAIIEYRSVPEELDRFDELHRQRLCASCAADSAETRAGSLRRAFEKAAASGDTDFMVCANCAARWIPDIDIEEAVRGWLLVFTSADPIPAAVLCAACARAHPEPGTLPRIAHLLLSRSRGPLQ
jgi:hypothetical protein